MRDRWEGRNRRRSARDPHRRPETRPGSSADMPNAGRVAGHRRHPPPTNPTLSLTKDSTAHDGPPRALPPPSWATGPSGAELHPGRPVVPKSQKLAGASRATARASRRAAKSSGRAAGATVRRLRKATHAQGAGESGLAKLIELHGFNAAGDTAVAISLAGTLFFQVPTGEARGQVALFLLLTMLPFAFLAPLIGPVLDRFQTGRRWAIGATLALRAFLCWVLAGAVVTDSVALFPAALGVLVASKAYQVTRAAAVPRLLPRGIALVTANSRVSLAAVAGAAVSAPIAGGFALIGPQWTLRYAFVVFVVATVLAVLLPRRVDSPVGEQSVGLVALAEGSKKSRRLGVTPIVVTALRCNAGLRILSGFLVMFMAFLLRERPIEGYSPELLIGMVAVAAGVGSTTGTVIGSWVKARKPQVIVVIVLVLDAAMAIAAAVFYGLTAVIALGLVAGLCQQLGKLSLDAVIQSEVPEAVQTSAFARSETLLQLSWVLGGGMGIVMPLIPQLGLGVVAGVLVVVLALVARGAMTHRGHRGTGYGNALQPDSQWRTGQWEGDASTTSRASDSDAGTESFSAERR